MPSHNSSRDKGYKTPHFNGIAALGLISTVQNTSLGAERAYPQLRELIFGYDGLVGPRARAVN